MSFLPDRGGRTSWAKRERIARMLVARRFRGGAAALGVDVESTPLVVLAVLAGVALAALAASRIGMRRGFLLVVVVIGVALDVREVVHQLDESRTGVAVIAMAVAVLHFAVIALRARR